MFSFNMFPEPLRPFSTQYRCYSVLMLPGTERHDVEQGGKIIMPPSALEHLTRLNIVYPMLFRLTNQRTERQTHCGVLEFVADEGKVYLPHWMMRNLLLEEGGLVQVDSATLPTATFSKFQPQSQDFLEITNPKAVLENALRSFACLTKGDMIAIKYNDHIYELQVLETKPGNAVGIIECDMTVDFAAPPDYQEPVRVPREQEEDDTMSRDIAQYVKESRGFKAFTGEGNRLDGKKKNTQSNSDEEEDKSYVRGIPDYDYDMRSLKFWRNHKPAVVEAKPSVEEFQAFSGQGQSLRQAKSNKKN